RGQLHVKLNLSYDEHKALMTLKGNKELIIKPADKGGSIVILDRTYYMEEIPREIKDLVIHYSKLGTIDEKLGEFLINHYPVVPFFYTLPKIHKHPSKPPGRPIVASTNSILSPLAITLEKILSPQYHSLNRF
ncbi:unnamed protein product, partial [Ranitomeya imitator]